MRPRQRNEGQGHRGLVGRASRWLIALALATVMLGPGHPAPVGAQDACPEPNDDRRTACLAEPGIVGGQIDRAGDVDVYRFESLDFGAVAHLGLDVPDGALTARLLDWNDRVLGESASSLADVTLPAPGAYYVSVQAPEGRSESVAYHLSLDLTYPGAAPSRLYRNTFSAPADGDWIELKTGATWRYEVADGGLHLAPMAATTTGTSFRSWPTRYTDVTLTVDGQIEEGWTDDGDTGLLVGARDTQRTADDAGASDGFEADVEASGRTSLSLRQYGARQWLAPPALTTRPIGPGEAVRITVRVQGDEVEVLLNGTSMLRARDATFAAGRVILGAYTNGPRVRARFDDLLVTTPTTGQVSVPLSPGLDRSPGAVLFADDFEDPAHSRLEASQVTGPTAWAFVDGEFAVQIVDPTWPNQPLTRLPVASSSAVMQVDARIVGDVNGRYIALACRDQGTTPASMYKLYVDPSTGRFSIAWWDAGTAITRARWTASDAIRRGNAVNTIELGCVNTTIFARINGTEVARVSESAYPNGAFTIGGGVFTEDKPATSDVRFDNIVVRQF